MYLKEKTTVFIGMGKMKMVIKFPQEYIFILSKPTIIQYLTKWFSLNN